MNTNTYNYSTEFRNAIRTAIQPWVEWKHIPMGIIHCPTCLKLDKCWFVRANMPTLPQHEKCHCTVLSIPNATIQSQAKAVSPYGKFANYVFDAKNPQNKGKSAMFESWGYTTVDSKWLMEEYERQAREKYVAGEYTLGMINMHGQRISIQVTLPRKNGTGSVTFITGWMVEANGKIRLVTPYGGK